jgi:hypothetical protein
MKSAKQTRVNLLCLEAVAFLEGVVHFGRLEDSGVAGDSAESPGTFPTAEREDEGAGALLPLCVGCDSGSSVRTG